MRKKAVLLRGKEALRTTGKRNIAIIAGILALVAVLLAVAALMPKSQSSTGESEILITVDGREWQHKKILREPSSRFVYSATQHTSVGTTIEKQSDRYPGKMCIRDRDKIFDR